MTGNTRVINPFNNVAFQIMNDGMDYAFRCYSTFDEVEDEEFHRLREAYLDASYALEEYVNSHADEDYEEEE